MASTVNWVSGKKRQSFDTEEIGPISADELCQLLQALTEEADRIISSSSCSFEQYQEMRAALSEIGELLPELVAAKAPRRLTPLLLLYSEFEATVAEIRNDLIGSHTC